MPTFTYQECNDCSNNLLIDSNRSVTVICNDCTENYSPCEDCNEVYNCEREGGYIESAGHSVCDSCYSNNYSDCDDCGERVSDDDLEGGFCSDCGGNSVIKPYDYDRPSDKFVKIGDGPHYGLELELYYRSGFDADDVSSLLDELNENQELAWVAKRDGSIDEGFELESLPFSRESIQSSLSLIESYKDRFKGFHGENNGLHVNLDRPKSRLHILKIAHFMNNKHNREFIEHIGQRGLNTYCRQVDVSIYDISKEHGSSQKYSPVKVDQNRLEFRIFKANMLVERINKAIDFCQAVVDYCGQAPLSKVKHYTSEIEFTRFVLDNQKQYPALVDYLLDESPQYASYIEPSDYKTRENHRRGQALKAFGSIQLSVVETPTLELMEA